LKSVEPVLAVWQT